LDDDIEHGRLDLLLGRSVLLNGKQTTLVVVATLHHLTVFYRTDTVPLLAYLYCIGSFISLVPIFDSFASTEKITRRKAERSTGYCRRVAPSVTLRKHDLFRIEESSAVALAARAKWDDTDGGAVDE
jgi:hypothetical protein